MKLTINGQVHEVDAPADMPLLWVLRDLLGMTGTKYGCGIAACGACTVLLNGAATRACSIPIAALADARIDTIEQRDDATLAAVRQAWIEADVVQCGYCQSGQIMGAVSLLKATPKPDDAQIDAAMRGNLCRCGTYGRIRSAIHRAAAALAKGG